MSEKKEHKCQELELVNAHQESRCHFTIQYMGWGHTSIFAEMPEWNGEETWKLCNNDDDYYSPAYINHCPFCGEKLKGE